MQAFVRTEEALEPVMPHLVMNDGAKTTGVRVTAGDDGDHGVFHAAAGSEGSFYCRGMRIGIGADPVGEVRNGLCDVAGSMLPAFSAGRPKERYAGHPMPIR
jgi:hypothetical protein